MEDITPTELQEKKLKITVSDLTLILYFNIHVWWKSPQGGDMLCRHAEEYYNFYV